MFVAAFLDLYPELEPGLAAILDVAEELGGGCARAPVHHDGVLTGRRFLVARPSCRSTDGAVYADHHHVHWRGLRDRIQRSKLPEQVASHVLGIFAHLATAEAKIHGKPVDDVAFHEVGAWDSITDIVAAGYIMSAYPSATWSIGPLPIGSGRVSGSHGQLPVPAPATVELLRGFTMHHDGLAGERVTPTGAAILRHIAPEYRPIGVWGRLSGSGQGFGSRKLAQGVPNMLRVLVFEAADSVEVRLDSSIAVLNFEIDDQSGEDLAIACDNIRTLEGVLDVLQLPAFGKKGRMVTQVRVLAQPERMENVASACLTETSTLGLRVTLESRRTLSRAEETVEALGKQIPVKQARRPDGSVSAKAASDVLAEEKGGYAIRKTLREAAERASGNRKKKVVE